MSSAAQIADLGGGALMAAVGMLVALRERDRSGQGQLVDCSMFDGSLSFLAMLAGEMLAGGPVPRRGELRLAGGLVCYRPYRCADGYVTLGALEPKFWSAFCRGVGREDLAGHAFDPPGSETHRELERSSSSARASSGGPSPPSTTAVSSRCWIWTRRWTASWWQRGRWWSSSISPAPSARSGCSGSRSS